RPPKTLNRQIPPQTVPAFVTENLGTASEGQRGDVCRDVPADTIRRCSFDDRRPIHRQISNRDLNLSSRFAPDRRGYNRAAVIQCDTIRRSRGLGCAERRVLNVQDKLAATDRDRAAPTNRYR